MSVIIITPKSLLGFSETLPEMVILLHVLLRERSWGLGLSGVGVSQDSHWKGLSTDVASGRDQPQPYRPHRELWGMSDTTELVPP